MFNKGKTSLYQLGVTSAAQSREPAGVHFSCTEMQSLGVWPEIVQQLQDVTGDAGHLHRPFILAEPGPVVHRGSSVTFVCRGPRRVDTFRLQKEEGSFNETMSEKESHLRMTEAIFPITSASEHHAGHYRCIYYKRFMWSEHSKFLELKVTDEGTTQGPPTSQALPSDYGK
ncbi:leukocyte-associated immunoglobulin-like receptor 1 isoform X2 [Choloepus didactylus]|uniref:leukocyte-associated immunoglobulin-like receptor 1 isoform X2 n=1 Tax=Choloepus didactylus TaxID=27675 RepID=UPI00189E3BDA|nr:leukocyte-associated immunoglobulin-like receptor 1 isoform X2 [Choloepus didactylus]